ncbi:DUF5305 domain-containing protein [Natrinema sp. 1APR25-10V2]|uniref:DUF5305 domain-containing protein n=1 Tax=Natrinema sp. 1APR25-10V2 TaxID=2951081 RepID=UPI0028762263|nr:DUF5305 domain-containing protein [Natrinema sp. 1APR25-10V2]MDS0473660.1 DUF5305 domain-containing protein [Natrinema sp. 1APR25-10V2]
MNSDRLVVRARAALDEWYVVAVVALLALALVGGWGAYAAVAGSAEQTSRQPAEAWSATGSFDHGAEVQRENEVYPVGTRLSDRSVYFTRVTPELEGNFTYRYDADAGDVTADVELERVIRSADDQREYWEVNKTIAETTVESLGPGETATTDFAVDVPATVNESERIQESLGGSPGSVETTVVATVTIQGTIDGDPVERTERYELAITPDGATYGVDAPTTADQPPREATDPTTTASSAGFVGPIGSVLLLLASLGALGALAVARANGTLAPSEAELERLRMQYEREEFDDWISRGSLPNEVRERSRIEVSTLEDLVDVAIDCDRRVLEDEAAGGYYVVDGDSLYAYEPAEFEADLSVDAGLDLLGRRQTGEEKAVAGGSDDGGDGQEDAAEDDS